MLTEYIRHVINTLSTAEDMPDAEGGCFIRMSSWDHEADGGHDFSYECVIEKKQTCRNRQEGSRETQKVGEIESVRACCRWGLGGLC